MYTISDLVKIAKRENNKKRNYLIVNKLQGKHIPVIPSEAFAVFENLAQQLEKEYQTERLLLIGFAETATAIGAAIADKLNANYIQTTRETLPDVEYLYFSEEHSHATEQKLVKNDLDRIKDHIDRIIFIEDEVTTGKTIQNLINLLTKYYPEIRHYSVASLLNGMDEKTLLQYKEKGISFFFLVKTDQRDYSEKAESFVNNGDYIHASDLSNPVSSVKITVKNYMDTRRLVEMNKYRISLDALWKEIDKQINVIEYQNVLVIGTEEFMYPALYVARQIEEKGLNVRCHSTTRSPIVVCKEKDYPLHARYELKSFYDEERITYIYDLSHADCVLILTDAQDKGKAGAQSLLKALSVQQNTNIFIIRWC